MIPSDLNVAKAAADGVGRVSHPLWVLTFRLWDVPVCDCNCSLDGYVVRCYTGSHVHCIGPSSDPLIPLLSLSESVELSE